MDKREQATAIYAQEKFLEHIVDTAKRRYLQEKRGFPSFIIPFYERKAALIPFIPRDEKHKDFLQLMLTSAFAAKGVSRFAFFLDTWIAEVTAEGHEGATLEEMEKLAAEERQKLPARLVDYEGKKEAILWGIYNEAGLEKAFMQIHDSNQHKLLSKAESSEVAKQLSSRFSNMLPMSKQADFSKGPLSKAEMWDMMGDYFRSIDVPMDEVRIY